MISEFARFRARKRFRSALKNQLRLDRSRKVNRKKKWNARPTSHKNFFFRPKHLITSFGGTSEKLLFGVKYSFLLLEKKIFKNRRKPRVVRRLSGREINKQIRSVFDNRRIGIRKRKLHQSEWNYAEAHMRSRSNKLIWGCKRAECVFGKQRIEFPRRLSIFITPSNRSAIKRLI